VADLRLCISLLEVDKRALRQVPDGTEASPSESSFSEPSLSFDQILAKAPEEVERVSENHEVEMH
ncbi:MAG: hypothetical protein M1831_001189, partial [Alyxoria varia]